MKKLIILAVVAAASSSFAIAGDGYVGGNVGFIHEENDGLKTNKFTFLPEIGYSFNNHWAVGTTIGYEYTHFNGYDMSSHIFAFDPYARYTFFKTNNGLLSLFIDGTVGLGAGTVDYGDESSDTAFIWQIGVRPGLALHFTEKFSMVAHIGFLGYKGANNTAMDAGYSRLGGIAIDGNNIQLGFYYHF